MSKSKHADAQGRIGFTDFLRQVADLVEGVEMSVNEASAQQSPDKWWELFDLDVEPKTRATLDAAWKAWRITNHPDKGVCSDQRFRHMAHLYEQQRARMLV